jgi:hypothetical protein
MHKYFLFLAVSAAVFAQNFESWVSVTGGDFAACTYAAPCKTFSEAYAVTNDGGIIHALGSGDFGGIGISKSITIEGAGPGTVIQGGNPPVSIAVTAKNVTLRNLTVHASCSTCLGIAAGLSTTGGIFGVGSFLNLESVTVTAIGSNQDAIQVTADSLSGLFFKNVSVYGGSNGLDLFLQNGAVPWQGILEGVSAKGASNQGLRIGSGTVTVRDSNFSQNFIGIETDSNISGSSIFIDRTILSQNLTGLSVTAGVARISGMTITSNNTGITASGGAQIITFRNNALAGNNTDGSTPFSVSLK